MYFIVLWISYVFLCFFNLLFFLGFFGEICGRHFLKHNNAKTNSFQSLRVKISIFIWTMWKKLNLHWFCTQNHILEPFSVRRACTKSYVTSEPTVAPGVTNFVSKCAGNLKEKSHKVSRRELCALQSNRAKCRGGPFRPPPPSLFRVKTNFYEDGTATKVWNIWTKNLLSKGYGGFVKRSIHDCISYQVLLINPPRFCSRRWTNFLTTETGGQSEWAAGQRRIGRTKIYNSIIDSTCQ